MSGAARPLRACTGEAPEGLPARVAHSPCGEARAGTRSDGWSGAGARSPCGEARAGTRSDGRTGAGARSPCGEAHAGDAVMGGPAQVNAPLARRRMPVTLWWADRRGCTLPYGRRGADRAVEGGPARVHAPLREARRRSRCGGRTGTGARSPCGEAHAGHAVVGGPAQVHAPLREARRRSRCGGRTGAGARSLTGGAAPIALWWADRHRCTLPLRGGAEHRLPIAARDRTYVRTLTINPLDKACQGSLAGKIGLGGQGRAAPASPRLHPNPLPAETFALLGPGREQRPLGARAPSGARPLSVSPRGGEV